MKSTLENLHDKLDQVQATISKICQHHGVDPEDLEHHLDLFADDQTDILLDLLKRKLALQRSIFEEQGGSLENVVFMSSWGISGN